MKFLRTVGEWLLAAFVIGVLSVMAAQWFYLGHVRLAW